MKVAIVYDRVVKWGGAERVLLALHELFPKAPLYTSVYDQKNAPWAKVFPQIYTSFLQNIPLAKKNHEKLALLMPLAFESFNFSGFDLVISVTSEAAKGIKTSGRTKHVCYMLTPTRYLWSGYKTYFENKIFKYLMMPVVSYLRNWDKKATKRPDKIIAISTEVQKRIKKYYVRKSEIIFPPVELASHFKNSLPRGPLSESARSEFFSNVRPFYLVVSRLVKYKRVDLAIRTFNKLEKNLVIVGTGKEEKNLKQIAGDKIIFLGEVSDNELVKLYKSNKGLIFPQEEDFGIVAVEAQMFGTPVVAFKKGGALDTVTKSTGEFFDRQTVKSLLLAVRKFEKRRFNKKAIMQNAKRFSKARFKKEFLKAIKNI